MFIRPSHSRFYLFIYFYLFYRSICSACVRFFNRNRRVTNVSMMMMMIYAPGRLEVESYLFIIYLLSVRTALLLLRVQCSASCGRGWRYRTVQCKYGDNSVLKSYCDADAEPDSSTVCNAGPCPTWKTGIWGMV